MAGQVGQRAQGAEGAISGYIEGYFGALLGWPQRMQLLEALAECGHSHWLYGPKADPLHRTHWRKPYGADWLRGFSAFCARAGELGVTVVGSVAPGLDWDWGSDADVPALATKYRQLLDAGCGGLALLFDDIEHRTGGVDGALAESQLRTLQALRGEFAGLAHPWWFCPTQYCSDMVDTAQPLASEYMAALQEGWNPAARLLWTGEKVIAPAATAQHLQPLRDAFGEMPILWDNHYATDWCPRRMVLAPMLAHAPGLPVLLNPTGRPVADALYLRLLGRHMAGEPPQQALHDVLRDMDLPGGWQALLPLCPSPLQAPGPLTDGQAQDGAAWLQAHLYEPHPLLVEWYPVLRSMLADLQAADPRRAQRLPPSAHHPPAPGPGQTPGGR